MEDTAPRTKILKNGAVYDMDRKRIIANPGGGTTAITPARSKELRELRAARTAKLLRDAIVSETADVLQMDKKAPAEAIAAAGGILWREIVLNSDAYPRDRISAFSELSDRAEMTSKSKHEESPKTLSPAIEAAALEVLAALRDAISGRDVVDGKVTDVTIPVQLCEAESDEEDEDTA